MRREKRTREKESGAKPDADEKGHWAAACVAFAASDNDPPPKRARRFIKAPDHQASLDWIREFDNALRHGARRRWSDFELDLARFKDALAILTVELLFREAPFIASTLDQAPWQMCSSWFLRYHLHINFVPLWDPGAHRIHNDYKAAIRFAGLQSKVYCCSTLFNFITGPSSSRGKWRKVLTEQVLDIKAFKQEADVCLQLVWAQICRERGWVSPDDTNADARSRFLENIDCEQLVGAVGEMIANARWLSFPKGEAQKRQFGTSTFLLLIWGIDSGTVGCKYDVFWKFKTWMKSKTSIDESAASVAAAGDAGGSSTASCKAARSSEMDSHYRRCKNQIHVCLELAGDADLRDVSRRVGIATQPWCRSHRESLKLMKSPDGCLKYYYNIATWQWLITDVFPVLEINSNIGKLEEMGCTVRLPPKFLKQKLFPKTSCSHKMRWRETFGSTSSV